MAATLLIVDDCEIMLALVRARTKAEGYRVVTASSWQAALGLAGSEQPDLVLLDLELAGVSGFEVHARLKADPRTRELPVIFLTACDDAATRARAFATGAVDYVVKPFEPADFRARLKSALARRPDASRHL
jgi:putative two-component system response regulator